MSRARGILPMVLATAIGITTGTVIFQPALKEEKEQKEQEQAAVFQDQHSPSPEEQVHKTEEAVAIAGGATTISKDTPRWAEVQAGTVSESANSQSLSANSDLSKK